MQSSVSKQLEDARQIWHAGVQAVHPSKLIPETIAVDGLLLWIDGQEIDLEKINRIAIVGAGKAGASMALALEASLGERVLRMKQVRGWVNVPGDCLVSTAAVHLHAARPAGVNEPTAAGVTGTESILNIVSQLSADDLCICLLSGGGSALLPAPAEGISLETMIRLTREIAARGGDIGQLNLVRRELSRVKGGGLARACQAGQLVSLILSDVLGDDLETIASGPTVWCRSTPDRAIRVLEQLGLDHDPAGAEAVAFLKQKNSTDTVQAKDERCSVRNIIVGNNATAVDGAGVVAEKLGYGQAMISAPAAEGPAEEVARRLVSLARDMRANPGPDCLISGGEPTVQLAPQDVRGKGGRNQQLALAALTQLEDWRGIALVSGGTDGEDGPTDAAGAMVDQSVAERASSLQLDAADYLRRNDAYHYFQPLDALLKTGPTHTNVCDLRVICVEKRARAQ